MKKLILIGGGGHCKSCIDVVESEGKYSIEGILDTEDKVGGKVLDFEIIGTDDDIEKFAKQGCEFLITLGQIKSAELRKKLYEKVKIAGGKFATVVSPDAYVSKYASTGAGTIIMNGAFVNAGTKIGNNCIINTKAVIEHDCKIGDNCHIAIGAVLAGEVTVEQESFIGANATVVQGVTIPQKSFIKAGSLIK